MAFNHCISENTFIASTHSKPDNVQTATHMLYGDCRETLAGMSACRHLHPILSHIQSEVEVKAEDSSMTQEGEGVHFFDVEEAKYSLQIRKDLFVSEQSQIDCHAGVSSVSDEIEVSLKADVCHSTVSKTDHSDGLALTLSCQESADLSGATSPNVDKIRKSLQEVTTEDTSLLQWEKLCQLERQVESLQVSILEVKELLQDKCVMCQHIKELPRLPLQSLEKAQEAEKLAKKKESIRRHIVTRLQSIKNGKNAKACSKRAMAILMTNSTGEFFNWRGSGGKEPFMRWILKDLVIDAMILLMGENVNTLECEEGIKEWLKERKFRKN